MISMPDTGALGSQSVTVTKYTGASTSVVTYTEEDSFYRTNVDGSTGAITGRKKVHNWIDGQNYYDNTGASIFFYLFNASEHRPKALIVSNLTLALTQLQLTQHKPKSSQ